jgi:hypothetical protein
MQSYTLMMYNHESIVSYEQGGGLLTPGLVTILVSSWLILFIWLALITWRFRKISKNQALILTSGKRSTALEAIGACVKDIERVNREIRSLKGEQGEISAKLTCAIQRVGLVRFDAFDDIGGNLSFAIALLDEKGNGIVFSTINGRQESRSYAKPVKGGKSSYNLSSEELEAIRQAMGKE